MNKALKQSMGRAALMAALGTLALGLPACGASDGAAEASADGGGGVGAAGVGQGGAQDFGQFRSILDEGGIPGPETLDDVGFFNEHKVEFPAPDCGDDVCMHGQLGVMGNMITGSNCTLVLLGMNTPVDPAAMERPPLNLSIVVDTSGSMQGDSIAFVREGLFRMLDDLEEDDRISLISFDDGAEVLVEYVTGTDPTLADAISSLQADGGTNIYEGLRAGYDLVSAHEDDGRQNRVIFLSDGEATAGITDDDRIVGMSKSYNELGLSLTTIGMGDSFNPELMRDLSESGAGAFYFLEDPSAVQEVFEEEVQTFLVPLAQDLRIDLDVDSGYRLRAMYGTKLSTVAGNSGSIDIPTVQIAHRTVIEDNAGGRRGGGGAIIAELVPVSPDAADERGTVGHLTLTYNTPGSEDVVAQEVKILSELDPGEAPEEGAFDDVGVEKAFVMLNVFAGFEMAADRARFGDYRGALGVLEPLAESVRAWVAETPDPDIQDDLVYIDKFIDNLKREGAEAPPPQQNPPEPWPQD